MSGHTRADDGSRREGVGEEPGGQRAALDYATGAEERRRVLSRRKHWERDRVQGANEGQPRSGRGKGLEDCTAVDGVEGVPEIQRDDGSPGRSGRMKAGCNALASEWGQTPLCRPLACLAEVRKEVRRNDATCGLAEELAGTDRANATTWFGEDKEALLEECGRDHAEAHRVDEGGKGTPDVRPYSARSQSCTHVLSAEAGRPGCAATAGGENGGHDSSLPGVVLSSRHSGRVTGEDGPYIREVGLRGDGRRRQVGAVGSGGVRVGLRRKERPGGVEG